MPGKKKKKVQLLHYTDGERNVFLSVCYLLGEYCHNIRDFTKEKVKQLKKKKTRDKMTPGLENSASQLKNIIERP